MENLIVEHNGNSFYADEKSQLRMTRAYLWLVAQAQVTPEQSAAIAAFLSPEEQTAVGEVIALGGAKWITTTGEAVILSAADLQIIMTKAMAQQHIIFHKALNGTLEDPMISTIESAEEEVTE